MLVVFFTVLLGMVARTGSSAVREHTPPSVFRLSNTFGDGMVLQRGDRTIVFGFGTPGSRVTATISTAEPALPAAQVGADGVWRIRLPAAAAVASKTPATLTFHCSSCTGAPPLQLADVVFGDVFLCGGQSNMQYTPHSMNGMNNLTAEVAAADSYADGIKFFTVGMETFCNAPGGTKCGTAHQNNCSAEFPELPAPARPPGSACTAGCSCRHTWAPASSKALGAGAWDTFSAVCWLFGKDVYEGHDRKVPVGLISSNWDGTCVEAWQPSDSVANDGCPGNSAVPGHSTLFNTMVAPFAVGPMALVGFAWYQGECNVGFAAGQPPTRFRLPARSRSQRCGHARGIVGKSCGMPPLEGKWCLVYFRKLK